MFVIFQYNLILDISHKNISQYLIALIKVKLEMKVYNDTINKNNNELLTTYEMVDTVIIILLIDLLNIQKSIMVVTIIIIKNNVENYFKNKETEKWRE